MVTQCYSNPYILQEWLFTQPHISIVEGLWSDPLVNKRGRGSFTYLWKLYILCWYIYICILYMYVYIYVTYTGAVDIYLSIDIELYTYIIYYIYYIYIHAQNRTFALSPHLSHTKWCSFSTDPVPVSLRDGLLPRVSFRETGCPRVPWCFTLCTLWLFVT